MPWNREEADRLIAEVRAAEDELLELIGPRAAVVKPGEPAPRGGPVIDEASHEKWEAAKARQQRAWDAWLEFVNQDPR